MRLSVWWYGLSRGWWRFVGFGRMFWLIVNLVLFLF